MLGIITLVIVLNGGFKKLISPDTVRAFGDLLVDFHVPLGDPIFVVNNMAPGDSEDRNVDVTNSGTVPRFISVKGIRTGGTGADPKIESVLDIVITNGSPIYGTGSPTGSKTLLNFFQDSAAPNGIMLNILNSGDSKTYNFNVTFPTSAGNPFQDKSVIFDLTFGIITGENLVINEVFYNVDSAHGFKPPKEKDLLKFQWVELYNPTDQEISLKNWTITDASGNSTIVHPNKKINAGGFAVLSKDASLWKYWDEPKSVLKVELGKYVGDGLGLGGDLLILKNKQGVEVDRMSWGTDTSGFTPPGTNPVVPVGHSTERLVPGFDTNAASDWLDRNPPTPGN